MYVVSGTVFGKFIGIFPVAGAMVNELYNVSSNNFTFYNYVRFVLFYVFYPETEKTLGAFVPGSEENIRDVNIVPGSIESPGWTWSKRIRTITLTCMSLIIFIAFLIEKNFGYPSSVSLGYSDLLGIISLTLSFFQFIPQIVETYKLQEVGALSITSMLMQTPGSNI